MMNKKLIFATVLFVSAASWGVWMIIANKNSKMNLVDMLEQKEIDGSQKDVDEGFDNDLKSDKTEEREVNKGGSDLVIVPEDSSGIAVQSEKLVLFYSSSCPHCKDVEEYITRNSILERVDIEYKEVSSSNSSSQLFAKAKDCGISTRSVGVPLMWDGSKCYMGYDSIVDFLNGKIIDK